MEIVNKIAFICIDNNYVLMVGAEPFVIDRIDTIEDYNIVYDYILSDIGYDVKTKQDITYFEDIIVDNIQYSLFVVNLGDRFSLEIHPNKEYVRYITYEDFRNTEVENVILNRLKSKIYKK